jgi:hypothetical protein
MMSSMSVRPVLENGVSDMPVIPLLRQRVT